MLIDVTAEPVGLCIRLRVSFRVASSGLGFPSVQVVSAGWPWAPVTPAPSGKVVRPASRLLDLE